MEKDMENYLKCKLVGGMLRLKKGVLPHKFECQKPPKKKIDRPGFKKRQDIEYFERVLSKEIGHENLLMHSVQVDKCESQDLDNIQNSDPLNISEETDKLSINNKVSTRRRRTKINKRSKKSQVVQGSTKQFIEVHLPPPVVESRDPIDIFEELPSTSSPPPPPTPPPLEVLKVCRICLAVDTKMFDITERNLDQMYEDITGMVATDDTLPQYVCWECTARLSQAVTLRNKAFQTDAILHDLMQKGEVTLSDIKAIDRSEKGLQTNLKSCVIEEMCINDEYQLNVKDINDPLKIKEEILMEFEEEEENSGPIDNIEFQNSETNEESQIIKVETDKMSPTPRKIIKKEIAEENDLDIEESSLDEEDGEQLEASDDEDDEWLKEIEEKVEIEKEQKQEKEMQQKKEKEDKKKPNVWNKVSTFVQIFNKLKAQRKKPDAILLSLFTITPLSYEQQIEEVNNRKESDLYLNAPYKCHICYRGSYQAHKHEKHMMLHDERNGQYECSICKRRARTSLALRGHMRNHLERYQCKKCSFNTICRTNARNHMKEHKGAVYDCSHCGKRFKKPTTYLGHLRLKHGTDLVCEYCGHTFLNKTGLMMHKKKTHQWNPDDNEQLNGPHCDECNITFVSETAYETHILRCIRHEFDSKREAISKKRTSITVDEIMRSQQPVDCEQCGIPLRSSKAYAFHVRRAHPDKKLLRAVTGYKNGAVACMCELCGKTFKSIENLKSHMWRHTGIKRFGCDACPKKFTMKYALITHIETVHCGKKQNTVCPICNKSFSSDSNKSRHMKIHDGVLTRKCEICHKRFLDSGGLKSHVEHVHMKKPWPKKKKLRPRFRRLQRRDETSEEIITQDISEQQTAVDVIVNEIVIEEEMMQD